MNNLNEYILEILHSMQDSLTECNSEGYYNAMLALDDLICGLIMLYPQYQGDLEFAQNEDVKNLVMKYTR